MGRSGEISDYISEGQHYPMVGLNLLARIIIHWNTARFGEIVANLTVSDGPPDLELLAHVFSPDWEYINLTGGYRWNA